MMPKMNEYVKTFNVKEGNKDKINKLMSFHIDKEKLLGIMKLFGLRLKIVLKNRLNALPVYDDIYIKITKRTYGDKIHTNFRYLYVSEDGIECECFRVILLILYLYNTKNITSKDI